MQLGSFDRWWSGRIPRILGDTATFNLGGMDRWWSGRPPEILVQQDSIDVSNSVTTSWESRSDQTPVEHAITTSYDAGKGWFKYNTYTQQIGVNHAVADMSGVDVHPESKVCFTIRNNGVYIRKIYGDGTLYNQSSALGSPFQDSEDICYTSPDHPDGEWAVINEQPYGSSKLLIFDYAKGDTGMPNPIAQYDMSEITGEVSGSGYGLESVSYDPVRDKFYIAMQSMNVGGLWEVDIETTTPTVTKLFDWSVVTAQGFGDSTWVVSSVCHGRRIGLPDSVFVLINNSGFTSSRVIECDYAGRVVSSMTGPGNKAEGFCFDSTDSRDMYFVCDNATGNNFLVWSTRTLSTVNAARASSLEALQSVSSSKSSSLEALQGVSSSITTSWESGGQTVVEHAIATSMEALGLLAVPRVSSLEALQGVLAARPTSLEAQQGVLAARATSLEAQQGISAARATSLEAMQSLAVSRPTSLEGLQGVQASKASSLEALQGILAALSTSWESRGQIEVWHAIATSMEALGLLAVPRVSSLEALQGVLAARPTSLEAQQGVGASRPTSLEACGGLAVSRATSFESQQEIGSAGATSLEALQGVQRAISTSNEALGWLGVAVTTGYQVGMLYQVDFKTKILVDFELQLEVPATFETCRVLEIDWET